MASMADFNQQIIAEFRPHAGRPPSWPGPSPLLLLHHRGARSGVERVNPLAYLRDGERYVIFASKAGAPSHPAWYHNLIAHPETTIEVGEQTVPVRAEEITGPERDRLFRAQAEVSSVFAEYEQRTDRVIPVIALTPRG